MNYEERDKLLAPYSANIEIGGLRFFRSVPFDVLQELIDAHFVEMESWNSCPGVADTFLPFLRRNPGFTAHGYAVVPWRKDVRVTIEGLEKADVLTKAEIIDFAKTFHDADELQITDDYVRCWYD